MNSRDFVGNTDKVICSTLKAVRVSPGVFRPGQLVEVNINVRGLHIGTSWQIIVRMDSLKLISRHGLSVSTLSTDDIKIVYYMLTLKCSCYPRYLFVKTLPPLGKGVVRHVNVSWKMMKSYPSVGSDVR